MRFSSSKSAPLSCTRCPFCCVDPHCRRAVGMHTFRFWRRACAIYGSYGNALVFCVIMRLADQIAETKRDRALLTRRDKMAQ